MAIKPYFVFTDLQVARINVASAGSTPAFPTPKLITDGNRKNMYAILESVAETSTNAYMKAIVAVSTPVAVEETHVTI